MCRSGSGMSWCWVCLPGTENSQTAQDDSSEREKGTAKVLVSTKSNLLFQFRFPYPVYRAKKPGFLSVTKLYFLSQG